MNNPQFYPSYFYSYAYAHPAAPHMHDYNFPVSWDYKYDPSYMVQYNEMGGPMVNLNQYEIQPQEGSNAVFWGLLSAAAVIFMTLAGRKCRKSQHIKDDEFSRIDSYLLEGQTA